MMINMTLHRFGIQALPVWVEFILATIAQFGPGLMFYKSAWSAVKEWRPYHGCSRCNGYDCCLSIQYL